MCNLLILLKLLHVANNSPHVAFVQFAPPAVWEILVTAVNRNLAAGDTVDRKRDPRRRDTSAGELLRFYGIQMAIENTYGNNSHSMREHFASLKKDMGHWFPQMGIDRFQALMSAFAPSPEELKQISCLLRERFMSHVKTGTVSSTLFVSTTNTLIRSN
jgi:hypothetical protein